MEKLYRILILLVAIIAGILLWLSLPKRVAKVENKVEVLTDNVNEFVVEQRTLEKGRDKREALMLELIKKGR